MNKPKRYKFKISIMSDYDDQKVFSTMCRLCLSQNVELVNLYPKDEFISSTTSTSEIVEIIEKFTTVKINPMDYLPQQICISCMQTIESMQSFQNECKRNDEELQRRLKDLVETKNDIEILDSSDTKELIELLVVDKSETKEIVHVMDEHETDAKDILKGNVPDFSSESDEDIAVDPDFPLDSDKESARNRKSKRRTKKVAKKAKKTPKSYFDGTFACYICGKRYHNYKLQYHINTHKGLRPFACNIDNCTSTFAAPYELQTHERTCHFRKNEFICDICGKALKRKPSLIIHLSYHFAPKIPCTVCEKLFKNEHALTKHMLVHTQERNFKCDECGKSYQTRYTLRIHKRVHTQEKPYFCHCGVSFAYKCLLKAHTEKHHKQK